MSVAVLGAVSLDRYVVVPNFPPEDSMVFAEQQFTPVGGSGANIAANLAISGIEVDFFCGAGDDESGKKLSKKLIDNKVKVHADIQPGTSAETLVIVDKEGKRRIISFGGNALYNKEPVEINNTEAVCIVDSFPDVAVKFLKKFGESVKIYVPGGCGLYFGIDEIKRVAAVADITILSEPEAEAIGNDFGCISECVIVTRGAKSTDIYFEEKEISIPVEPVKEKIIDTTGAGDAFASGFIFDYIKSRNIEKAIYNGHAFASRIITRYGANLGI